MKEENNNSEKEPCQICGSVLKERRSVLGYSNLWDQDLSEPKNFTFSICNNCKFTWNNNYLKINFHDIGYSNWSPSLDTDNRSKYLASIVSANIETISINSNQSKCCIVEIGAGKRLGFLEYLGRNLKDVRNIYAVDPTYGRLVQNSARESLIQFKTSYKDCNILDEDISILVFTNSIEYFEPNELSSLFAYFLNKGGLIAIEYTDIEIDKQGSCNLYSEYKCIYKENNILQLLRMNGFNVYPRETIALHGDGRKFCVIVVEETKSVSLVEHYFSQQELLRAISSSEQRVIMYGLGGRNIMALVNEMHGFIKFAYDSNEKRSRVKLPKPLQVLSANEIKYTDIIVVLNSRFINTIRQNHSRNKIFALML